MTILEAGKWLAKPETIGLGTSKNGKDEAVLGFRIKDGPDAGKQATAYLYFSSDRGMELSIEAMRNCGCTFPGADITNFAGYGDKDVMLTIEHEEWDGQTRAKVKWINAAGGVVMNPMDSGQKASFKERMRGQLMATAGQLGGGEEPPF